MSLIGGVSNCRVFLLLDANLGEQSVAGRRLTDSSLKV